MPLSELEQRARLYSQARNRAIQKPLGEGIDGNVWQTDKKTAAKVCIRRNNYENERECYRLFLHKGITDIHGFAVPRLFDFDDRLMAIEIAIVQPPFILDFGKVYLNRPPSYFTEEMRQDTRRELEELWGSHWPVIRKLLSRLESLGIYYLDARPKNILPANWDPPIG